jgi:hypothetical protein
VLPGPFGLARPVVMGVAVAVTLVTGLDYVHRAWRGSGRRTAGQP